MTYNELCLSVINYCSIESGKVFSSYEKNNIHKNLMSIISNDKNISHSSLVNYIFVQYDLDRFYKTKKIAVQLGIPLKKKNKTNYNLSSS